MNRRVAALDCGTNSLRLLVADVVTDPAGGRGIGGCRLLDVHRQMRIVRLGENVDRTGRLSSAALARTAAALREYVSLITEAGVSGGVDGGVRCVRLVATSAVRDAANRDDFLELVQRVLGVPAEVISGEAEARLSFAGVVHDLAPSVTGPVVVVDIGGGSTEVVRGQRGGLTGVERGGIERGGVERAGVERAGVELARTFDVGSVRLTERHIRHDPPTAQEVSAIEADVLAGWRAAGTGPIAAAEFVGVAGTVTTVAAVALGLQRYDSARIHGAVLTRAEVDRAVAELIAMDRAQRSARRVIHPGRVDVIAAGAVIMRSIMRELGAATVRVSEHDILDGVALSLLEPGLLDPGLLEPGLLDPGLLEPGQFGPNRLEAPAEPIGPDVPNEVGDRVRTG